MSEQQLDLPVVLDYTPEAAKVVAEETRLTEGLYEWEVVNSNKKHPVEGEKAGMLGIVYQCVAVNPDTGERVNNHRATLYVPIPIAHPEVPDYKVKGWQKRNFSQIVNAFFANVTPLPRKIRGVWMCGEEAIEPTEVDHKKALRATEVTKAAIDLWNNPDSILGARFFGKLTTDDGESAFINNPQSELYSNQQVVPFEEFNEVCSTASELIDDE